VTGPDAQPPAVWFSPSVAAAEPTGFGGRSVLAGLVWRIGPNVRGHDNYESDELPADAVRLVPEPVVSGQGYEDGECSGCGTVHDGPCPDAVPYGAVLANGSTSAALDGTTRASEAAREWLVDVIDMYLRKDVRADAERIADALICSPQLLRALLASTPTSAEETGHAS